MPEAQATKPPQATQAAVDPRSCPGGADEFEAAVEKASLSHVAGTTNDAFGGSAGGYASASPLDAGAVAPAAPEVPASTSSGAACEEKGTPSNTGAAAALPASTGSEGVSLPPIVGAIHEAPAVSRTQREPRPSPRVPQRPLASFSFQDEEDGGALCGMATPTSTVGSSVGSPKRGRLLPTPGSGSRGSNLPKGSQSPRTPAVRWSHSIVINSMEDGDKMSNRMSNPMSPTSSTEGSGPEIVPELTSFSERAVREAALADFLPQREYSFDVDGKVMSEAEFAPKESIVSFEDFPETADLVEPWWKAVRQLRAEMRSLHRALFDTACIPEGHLGRANGPGSCEPPPSPTMKERRRQMGERNRRNMGEIADVADEDDVAASSSPGSPGATVEERFRHICDSLALPASTFACHALTEIERGGHRLPEDFRGRGYLGNRCAEVLFDTLADVLESRGNVLGDLHRLDLAGQGLGNEAAAALARLLPRCPQLNELLLARNHISKTGAHILLEQIKEHPSIRQVTLEQNPMPSYIRVRVAEHLQSRSERGKRNKSRQGTNHSVHRD